MWEKIWEYIHKDVKADWGDYNLASVKGWVAAGTVLMTTSVGSYLPKVTAWVGKHLGTILGG